MSTHVGNNMFEEASVQYYMYKQHACFCIVDHKTASNSLSGIVRPIETYCMLHWSGHDRQTMQSNLSMCVHVQSNQIAATRYCACVRNVHLHVSCHIRASTLQRPPRVTMLRCFGQLNTQMVWGRQHSRNAYSVNAYISLLPWLHKNLL